MPPEFIKILSPEILKLIDEAFHKQQYNGVLSIIGKLLTSQVHDSYKTIITDWKTPDIEMLNRLTRDVWNFSAAKNWQQMRDLTLALKDENGNIREYNTFKNEAQKICSKYNENWLQAEYNQSIAASQNAARWVQFTAEKEDIPYLQYQTVGDSSVRASHALLDGIVRKVDDPFWSTHYPPNGWGCRCEVIQAVGANAPQKEIPNVGIPEMFRTNLAQTGLIYPKNHPYYIDIPKAEIRKSIAYLPPENTFVTYNISKDKVIEIHPLHGDIELSKNVDACKILKSHDPKANIKLMPIINENDPQARKKFYPKSYLDKFPNKNADLLYDGDIAEIETTIGTKTSIQNAIKHGKKQAGNVLVKIPDNVKVDEAMKIAKGQMNHYESKQDLKVTIFNSTEKKYLETKISNKQFEPVKSIDEAIKKAKSFGFNHVEVDGVDLKHINSVLEALQDEYSSVGKIKVERLVIKSGGKNGVGIKGGHYLSKETYRSSELYFNSDAFKINFYQPPLSFTEQLSRINDKIDSSERSIKMFEEKILKYSNDKSFGKKMKKEISAERSRILDYKLAKQKIDKAIEKGEKPIANNISALLKDTDSQIKCSVHHEFGHYIDDMLQFPKLKDGAPPSVYGSRDRAEYFAEYYAKYKMIGEEEIPEDVLKIFKSWKK